MIFATDEFFAVADNLLKREEPSYDPNAYCSQGKVMDGWESRRRRQPGHDWSIIRLAYRGAIAGVEVDTAYFTGNFAPRISIQAANVPEYSTDEHDEWMPDSFDRFERGGGIRGSKASPDLVARAQAAAVQRHAKRARLLGNGEIRRRITAQDINLALQWRGSEKIYAPDKIVPDSNNNGRIDLNAYLASETQARPPSEVGITVHWLAVDGTQPEIPQNPISSSRDFAVMVEDDEDTPSNSDSAVKVQQLLPRVLSEELQLYCTRITLAVERGGATPMTRQEQDLALKGLQNDAGLQELVPFLIHYVVTQIYQHIGNPEHCRSLVRLARALLSNPHLHLELHVSIIK